MAAARATAFQVVAAADPARTEGRIIPIPRQLEPTIPTKPRMSRPNLYSVRMQKLGPASAVGPTSERGCTHAARRFEDDCHCAIYAKSV